MEVLGCLLTEGMNEDLCWVETLGKVFPLMQQWHDRIKNILMRKRQGRAPWLENRDGTEKGPSEARTHLLFAPHLLILSLPSSSWPPKMANCLDHTSRFSLEADSVPEPLMLDIELCTLYLLIF